MRLLKINLLAFALILLSASVASAISIRLENTADPNQVAVFLDLEGSGVNVVGINVAIQSTGIGYTGAEPAPVLPQVGGQPGILLGSNFSWLQPVAGSYGEFSVSPAVPDGSDWVNVDFFRTALPTNGATSGTEDVLMATLNYDAAVFAEFFDHDFYTTDFGFFVDVGGVATRIDGDINLVNNLVPIPEPTTALMVGLGLVGLGIAGRRQA